MPLGTHHLLDAESKHSGETITQGANQVEESVALLHVVARVIRRKQVHAARKVTSLEEAKNQAERNKYDPVLDESKTDLGL